MNDWEIENQRQRARDLLSMIIVTINEKLDKEEEKPEEARNRDRITSLTEQALIYRKKRKSMFRVPDSELVALNDALSRKLEEIDREDG
ncbi:hypothetical protein [Nocardiopsis rhodophaea]|uniref:hypothetical protein n=1 Tax=Nocardiopsis rhodophaea TaxID=280238 RepID=UPI0031D3DE5E